MMEKRKILVTGGCGFIGSNLVNGLLDAGHNVTVLDFGGRPFHDDVTFLDINICDREAVVDACAGMDSIVHNASLVHTKHNQESVIWAVNHQGTLNVMEACRRHGIARLVYISSASAVYEGEDIAYGDETLPYSSISQAPYADSKIQAEKDVLAFSGTGVTQCCAIRPHVVFGAGDNRFMPAILQKAQAGKLKRAIGNRDKLSDFTYVSNLVDAVVMAEDKLVDGSPVSGQAYFITNGEPMAFFDFVEKVLVALGYPPITGKVPYWLAYSVAALAEGIDTLKGGTLNAENGLTRFSVRYMVTHHYFSIEKAYRDFGWKPRVSLEEGIQRTVAALQQADSKAVGKTVKKAA
ncbi:MAG: NAD(P)H steroid dehydrogenase [Pseudomonadales bacterium]|nr:NAD(P)H steroid dehydrogenase [Pseudomonadales bacterium]MEC8811800.1 NAD-dependent epimerase/dehydratase family protein [Pseudomonadota bacterium]HAG96598.1 NAD(P)H steroid dehydrogenase [Gammaproteobacteria bacterium]MAQ27387.1 NAD(P)H steroid dehydrogenase [Pseudomonadales bacterium]MBI26440.1 NAD(P)H steroid dehydrogenase [Pseudomonadales bacterium]|tara:strand:- start:40512 stop:41561 length:1050 start_codon:yes stop_codon:yes gene_type:complete